MNSTFVINAATEVVKRATQYDAKIKLLLRDQHNGHKTPLFTLSEPDRALVTEYRATLKKLTLEIN